MDTTFSRRSFLAATALAGAGMAATLAGCGQPSTASKSDSADAANAPATHNPVDTETCDIVIVGAGTAGMCAAARAAELGASVICLEKNGSVGGSSGAAEGLSGIGTYLTKELQLEIDEDEVFQAIMNFHHWQPNADVLRTFIKNSGATIDWLHENCGINFVTSTIVSPVSYRTWHLAGLPGETTPEFNQKTLIEPLFDYGSSLGVDFKLSCPGTGLMTEGDTVTGVYYSDGKDEHAIEASKGVILATGGYCDNEEMFERFTHIDFDRVHNWGVPGRDGDGIAWGLDLGAATHIPAGMLFSPTTIPETPSFYEKANWVFSWQPNFRVNQSAIRFVNEFNAPDFACIANAVLAQESCYSIVDQAYIDMINDVALPIGLDSIGYTTGKPLEGARDAVNEAVEAGRVVKADTIDELAEKLGLDPNTLAQSLATYNDYCADGVDLEFGAPKDVLIPLSTPPFYGAAISAACFASIGGLNVNRNLQVLKEDGSVIPNLYALGGDASSDAGRDYDVAIMPGSQQGWCATGGRLAVEHILGA